MTDKQSELLPCAHCGDEARMSKKRHAMDVCFKFYVECKGCGIKTLRFNTEAEARAAWNRRADAENWTTEVPTEEGWYALTDSHCIHRGEEATFNEVIKTKTRLMIRLTNGKYEYMDDFCKFYERTGRTLYWLHIKHLPLPGKEGM